MKTTLSPANWSTSVPLRCSLLLLFPLLFLLFPASLSAQSIHYNCIVDSTAPDTKAVMRLVEAYWRADPADRKQYWNRGEVEAEKQYDYFIAEYGLDMFLDAEIPINVLSIQNKAGLYQIKAQWSFSDLTRGETVFGIFNYYAQREGEEFKLFNALPINRDRALARGLWKSTQVGQITYYYPAYHSFDRAKAENLLKDIDRMCTTLKIPSEPFAYYLAEDFEELQDLRGVDYQFGQGGKEKPTGKADSHRLYISGGAEDDLHEVFHVLVFHHFPRMHSWTNEGLATLVGDSRDLPLGWHAQNLHRQLQNRPDLRFDQFLDLDYLDEYTSYQYVLGGLFALRIYEKQGMEGVFDLMDSGTTNAEYYAAVARLLDISEADFDAYLRRELAVEAGAFQDKEP